MPNRIALTLVIAGALLAPPAGAEAATAVSSNWAGYVVTPKSSSTRFRAVSASWVVPQGTCSRDSSGYSATWVGIGGYRRSSKALEQTGTEFDCNLDGATRYFAWYELVPSPGHTIRMTVQPGDRIDASVTVKGKNVTISLLDRTSGGTFKRTFAVAKPDTTSAEWIVEAPADCNGGQCVQLPISNFGALAFSGAQATTARGTRGTISDLRWSNTEVTLDQSGGTRRFAAFAAARGAQPSALSADGAGFSVTYTEQAPQTPTQPPVLAPGAGGA